MAQATPDILTGTSLFGGTGIQLVEDALKALQSCNAGAAAPSYAVAGTKWLDTSASPYVLKQYDGADWITVGTLDPTGNIFTVPALTPAETAFADGDATPSVASKALVYKTANTGATTITPDGATAGQVAVIRVTDANTTLHASITRTGMTIPCVAGDYWVGVWDGSAWRQIAGNVGMGQFVPLADTDQIGDWIPASAVAYTDVDVSDDGVRKGACAVMVQSVVSSSSLTARQIAARKNGSSATGTPNLKTHVATAGLTDVETWVVPLDDNGKFEALFDADWSGDPDVNVAYVVGYRI